MSESVYTNNKETVNKRSKMTQPMKYLCRLFDWISRSFGIMDFLCILIDFFCCVCWQPILYVLQLHLPV